MLIQVRPVDDDRWHGKKGSESFTRPKTFEVLYDDTLGHLATGLTKEEEEKYGNKLGADLSSKFNPDSPHSFWNSAQARIVLPNHTVYFDDTKALDFVLIKAMKASKLVANSLKGLEANEFPEATHVMMDEEEEVKSAARKIETKHEAIKVLMKMLPEAKKNIIQIMDGNTAKGQSDEYILSKINDIIEKKPDEFLTYANMDAKDMRTRAAILEGVQMGILNKENSSIYYMGEKMGYDLGNAVEYLNDPENQPLKIKIFEQLN